VEDDESKWGIDDDIEEVKVATPVLKFERVPRDLKSRLGPKVPVDCITAGDYAGAMKLLQEQFGCDGRTLRPQIQSIIR
jgi:hypothetical protein